MNEELIRDVSRLQAQTDGLIKPEKSIIGIDPFLKLPGLVGFWPMSGVQPSTGYIPNLVPIVSGATVLSLVNNNSAKIQHYNDLVPYADLDGVNQYFSIADNTDLDITGAEDTTRGSWAGVPGLTMGGWFWFDDFLSTSNTPGIMGKFDAVANQKSYALIATGAQIFARISTDGAANYDATALFGIALSWHHFVLRFIPSTELALFIDGVKVGSNAVATPASIFNSTTAFQIGMIRVGASNEFMDGRSCLNFLCANALSDALIGSLFQQTRVLFGV